MASTLHFDNLAPASLHAAFDAIDLALASRATAQGAAQGFQLHVADAIWGDPSISFHEPFLDTLAVDYGSAVHLTDFANAPLPSRLAINQWVAGQTAGQIPSLLPAGSISNMTRVVLVNAIDFAAAWRTPFQTQQTTPGTFTHLDGSTVPVQMMNNFAQNNVEYGATATCQVVTLPYADGSTAMTIVLPAPGEYAAIEAGLGSATYAEFMAATGLPLEIDLSVPKFTIPGATFSLKTTPRSHRTRQS